jgi:hypothetical protein
MPRPVLAAAYALGVSLAMVNVGLFLHLESERASITQQRAGTSAGAYQLLPGSMRGSDENAFRLPPGPEPVALRLRPSFAILPGRYSVSLKDAKDAAVWRSDWSVPPGRETSDHISVALPGGVLQEGSYVLELARSGGGGGSEPLADYRFKVTK